MPLPIKCRTTDEIFNTRVKYWPKHARNPVMCRVLSVSRDTLSGTDQYYVEITDGKQDYVIRKDTPNRVAWDE